MRKQPPAVVRTRTGFAVRSAAIAAAVVLAGQSRSFAVDVFWGNETLNGIWSTTDGNFEGAPWNNAAGNGAIFDALAPAAVTVPADVNAASVSVTVNGYSFSGAGAINLVPGTSTLSPAGQSQRIFSVGNPIWTAGDTIPTVTVSNAINTTGAFQKMGTGILNHTGSATIGGTVNITANGSLKADVMVGSPTSAARGGVLKYNPGGMITPATRVGIGNGFLDIGASDVTIAELTYASVTLGTPWDGIYPGYNANNGVVGTGKLRVTGEIHAIGWSGGHPGAFGNSLGANLDLGGGTQIVRVGGSNTFQADTTLMFTGVLSNGSLLKAMGVQQSGNFGPADGISLYGNNTYTGDSVFNGGTNAIYGTNATQLVKAQNAFVFLRGANGSALSATTLQAFGSGAIILDNNAGAAGFTTALTGNNVPQVVGAINNDRLNDAAQVQLRDGIFRMIGRADTANPTTPNPSSETIGSISVLGGHNTINLVAIRPSSTATAFTGSVQLNVAGNLTMSPRSTLQISATGTPFSSTILPVLGVDQRLIVGGTIPTADATGILPRVATATDFVTYDATNGFVPLAAASYVNNLTTPGANVDLTTAAGTPIAVPASISINALKSSATAASIVSIDAGQTLTIASGMILATGGTRTIAGPGTLDFGSKPGVFLGGTVTVTAPVTGSDGAIVSAGTVRLENLSGLTGDIDVYGGTLNQGNTGGFNGAIRIRAGSHTLVNSVTGSTTGWGTGTIHLGNPDNDANLYGTVPVLSLGSGATMANAVIASDIVVNNGTTNLAGLALPEGLMPQISPLSNTTGSQTLTGNVTLTTSVNFQGGGAGGAGATNFNGNFTGPGVFRLTNGRVVFNGDLGNTGGLNMGRLGNSTQVTFAGTTSVNAPMTLVGGNTSNIKYEAGGLPTGTITVISGTYFSPTSNVSFAFIPLDNNTINNSIVLAGGDITLQPGTGVTGTIAGPITGSGQIVFNGGGTMLLTDAAQAQTGPLILNIPAVTTPVTPPGVLGIRHRRTHQGNTTLAAGTTLRLGAGTTGPDLTGTSKFNETTSVLSIAGGATPTATLDIGHQAVIFDYATTSPEATLRAQILAGRNAGAWTGFGITSSAAAAAPTAYAVGYADAADAASALAGVLMGQSFDGTSVLVRYTRSGDANLDGTVNFDDLLLLAANYNQSATKWSAGDFDYSGNVNFDDLLLLAANYNQSLPASLGGDWALALSSVPEPTSMLTVVAVVGGTLGRRRRGGVR